MLDRTFQLVPGIGPAREKALWRQGVRTWSEFPAGDAGVALSPRLDPAVREALARAGEALQAGDARRLAAMLPSRERWRLFSHFAAECAYLDIETDASGRDAQVTAIGVLWRGQVYSFVPGFDLDRFPDFARQLQVLVTFNGACFDVPVLERFFPGLELPRAHIDLRFFAHAVGLEGGLKRIERELGLGRPEHLREVDGLEAVRLWEAWKMSRSAGALRTLVEYNLYDAVQLKPLLERLYNRAEERALAGAEPLPETDRGDLLHDITRVVRSFG